jgi:hypothetical protein
MTAVSARGPSKSSRKPPKAKAKAKANGAKAKANGAKPKSNGWGGKREGAGRKLTPGRLPSAPHRVRVLDVARHPILVTMRARPEIPSLRSARMRELYESVLSDQRSRPYAKAFEITAHAAVEKELRLIVKGTSPKAQAALRAGMSGLFIAFARRLNTLLGRKGKVWSDRWDGRELETPQALREAMASLFGNGNGKSSGKAAKTKK